MTDLTYIWLREDGTPYYVGKDSSGQRAFRKECPPADRVIVQEYPCEAAAFAAEVFFIAFYGRKDNGTGILRNRTDGGEGETGRIVSQSTREKMRRSNNGQGVGRTLSEETRKRMSVSRSGLLHTNLTVPPSQKGVKRSAETCRRIGESKLGVKASAATRGKMRVANSLRLRAQAARAASIRWSKYRAAQEVRSI